MYAPKRNEVYERMTNTSCNYYYCTFIELSIDVYYIVGL